ncbi:MAG: Flp family type IVb pilin [Candidatus Baltobacteraceae bacterium]
MKDTLQQFMQDESGATLVEYGLIVSLIAIACIAAITALGGKITTLFTNIGSSL